MKAKELHGIIMRLLPLLELYQDYTLEEMLEDIYRRCKPGMQGKTVPPVQANSPEINLAEDIVAMPDNKPELMALTKAELQELGRRKGIKLLASLRKEQMAERLLQSMSGQNLAPAASSLPGVEADAKLAQLAQQLRGMSKEKIISTLEAYRRNEIRLIGRLLNLKIPTSTTKNNAILIIANHFSYLDVHRQMGEQLR